MNKNIKYFNPTQFLILGFFFIFPISAPAQLTFEWAQQGGGTGLDQGHDIAIDTAGNVYTTGVYESDAVFTPNPGVGDTLYHTAMADAFLVKYDGNGIYQWAIRIIGDITAPGNQNQISYSVDTDLAGNAYITGRIDSKSDFNPSDAPGDTLYLYPDDGTAFIAKYDANGQLAWARNFGGSAFVQGTAIQVSDNGNIFLHGYFNGTANFDPSGSVQNVTSNGGYDFYIAQFDNTGNLNWVNSFGATGNDFAADMILNANDDIFICARFEGTVDFDPGIGNMNLTSAGSSDPVVARYTQSGALVWAGSIAGTGTEYIFKIAVDDNDNIAVVGYIDGSADFDFSTGNLILTSNGGQDGFIAHYDGSGNLNWAINPGNSINDAATAVAFNSAGDVFLTGVFEGTINLNPNGSPANFTVSQRSMYIAQYDTAGNYIWAGIMGGPSIDFINSAITDGAGNIYLTGGFQGPNADFNPDTAAQAVDVLSGFGFFDVFTLKLSADTCPPVVISITAAICSSDSILFAGQYLQQAGIYTDSLQSSAGCDSIAILDLIVNIDFFVTVDTLITQGDSILISNIYVSTPGTYFDTLIAVNGCDSIITFNVDFITGMELYYPVSFHIWPNPTDGIVHFSGIKERTYLRLYNLSGILLEQHRFDNDKVIDFGSCAKGIYMLHIFGNSTGENKMVRLVIH